ncbi:MAG: MFS transporter [Verrucomicrobiota bacterium]
MNDVSVRTLRWELVRAASAGLLETAYFTFALLIAIEKFEASSTAKSLLLSSQFMGLLVSLFLPALLSRSGWSAPKIAMVFSLAGAWGFGLAFLHRDSEVGYLLGMCMGFFFMALQVPLQTQWLRANVEEGMRGRFFGWMTLTRAGVSIAFGVFAGAMLGEDFGKADGLLLVFAVATLIQAFAVSRIPAPTPEEGRNRRLGVFAAMRWARHDHRFRRVLISAMVLGMGVLMTVALRVDYLVLERYGWRCSPEQVVFLTTTLPAITRVVGSLFWGRLFDRMNVFRLRVVLNGLFVVAVALFFWSPLFWGIAVGAGIFGLARSGGEIVWNLWVTKLAQPEHTGEYMAVHTFFTGVRGLVAPFLGFALSSSLGLPVMVGLCVTLMLISVIVVWPLLREDDGPMQVAERKGG